MPNPSQNSLHGYLSKIKRETEKLHLYSSNSFTSSKKWVLSKHPKKLFFSPRHKRRNSKTRFPKEDHLRHYHHKTRSATLSDIDYFLAKNFKSLFIKEEEDDDEDRVTKNKEKRNLLSSSDDEDDDYSHRFERTWAPVEYAEHVEKGPFDNLLKLVRSCKYDSPKPPPSTGSSEGSSSMDTTSTSEERHSRSTLLLPENCIAVIKYTEEPQKEFRRSMVEMLESKLRISEREVDWESIKELLLCYLDLNDEKSHKYILNAFVDLIITLLREKENSNITSEGLVRLLSTRDAMGML